MTHPDPGPEPPDRDHPAEPWPEPPGRGGSHEPRRKLPDQDGPTEPLYGSVQAWVHGQFLPVYRRPLGGEYRWCPRWWDHAEALIRLTALWHSWEAMRLEPGTGMAVWLRDHLDHQMSVLLSRSGPFAQCTDAEHLPPRVAATTPAPGAWWLAEEFDDLGGPG